MKAALLMNLYLAIGAFLFFVCYYGAKALIRRRDERRRHRLAGKD